jgi:hypothetical protein
VNQSASVLQFWSAFSDVTTHLIWWGIPLFAFYIRPRRGQRNLTIRFFVGVIGVWLGLLVHREFIGMPVSMARARASGNVDYDGVGMNAALLLGGWILGLLGSFVALTIFLTVRRFQQR